MTDVAEVASRVKSGSLAAFICSLLLSRAYSHWNSGIMLSQASILDICELLTLFGE